MSDSWSYRPLLLISVATVLLTTRVNPFLGQAHKSSEQWGQFSSAGRLTTANGETYTTDLFDVNLVGSAGQDHDQDQESPRNKGPPLPLPLVIFRKYQQEHGAKVVREELAQAVSSRSESDFTSNRKYAVAPYWCPDRSGNLLHNLFNSVIWAVITNRTLLLQWDETNSNRNSKTQCEKVLQTKSWVSHWEDVHGQLRSKKVVPIPIDVERRRYDEVHEVVMFPQIVDLLLERKDAIPRTQWWADPLRKENQAYLADLSETQQQTLMALYFHKLDFLYGMIFREMFDILPEQQLRQDLGGTHSGDEFSLALHSRHIGKADDGTFVSAEKECLKKLLPTRPPRTILNNNSTELNPQNKCIVHLISDRVETVDLLEAWMRVDFPWCLVHRTNTTKQNQGGENSVQALEHGPYAGAGFFDDLAQAILARDAIVGESHQSSFKLIHELIVYDRSMEAIATASADSHVSHHVLPKAKKADRQPEREAFWKRHAASINIQMPPPLPMCSLPHRRAWGYSYGPGTPTFFHKTRIPVLRPVQKWNEFRDQHQASVLEKSAGAARFVVLNFTCSGALEQDYQDFVSGVIWTMIVKRHLMVRPSAPSSQECMKMMPDWVPRFDEWSRKLSLPLPSARNSKTIEFPNSAIKLLDSSILKVQGLSEHGPRFVRGMVGRDLFQRLYERYPVLDRSANRVLKKEATLSIDSRGRHSQFSECLMNIVANMSLAPSQIHVIAENETNSLNFISKVKGVVNSSTSIKTTIMCGMECQQHDYWQGWARASRARNAWIGPESSIILDEIEYQRVMEARSVGRFPLVLDEFQYCNPS